MVLIAAADGIVPFVKILRSGTSVARENAAGALGNLAASGNSEVSIAAAGGIGPLIELVRSGTSVAKEKAAGALRNLAFNDDNK
eukprot:3245371-Pleurochrysis_carterae.AAC.1